MTSRRKEFPSRLRLCICSVLSLQKQPAYSWRPRQRGQCGRDIGENPFGPIIPVNTQLLSCYKLSQKLHGDDIGASYYQTVCIKLSLFSTSNKTTVVQGHTIIDTTMLGRVRLCTIYFILDCIRKRRIAPTGARFSK